MNHDIAFLHTASVHIPTFQSLVEGIDPSLSVRHDVSERLLSDAQAQGITTDLRERVNSAMGEAAQSGARVVMCTCSTIGGVAELSPQMGSAVSMRIDRAMADMAVESSHRILIVAAVASTLEPTRELLNSSAVQLGRTPDMTLELVEGAWLLFEENDMDGYYDCIEKQINQWHDGYDSVVLAQASMAPVAKRFCVGGPRVLASPEIGVKAAIERFRSF